MTEVYVLCFGELSEGSAPLSAHSTLNGARAALPRGAGALEKAGDGMWMAKPSRDSVDQWIVYRLPVTQG
jgi:hypothetical protein